MSALAEEGGHAARAATAHATAPRELLILGAGGTALEVLDLLEALGAADRRGAAYRCLGCLDDDPRKLGTRVGSVSVVGALSDAAAHPDALLVDAIGSPKSHTRRERIVARASASRERFVTLVHPRAIVSPTARIGHGALVLGGANVGPYATLGDHVTILANTVVNHGASVGDWSLVGSGATLSGDVSVGRACYLGAGSHVIQGARIGDGALVGMGSVVIRDVEAGTVVVGNPARVLRRAAPPEGGA